MAFVSRHVLEPLIERKPLISEECMLVYKVSNFYINILTMLIRNRTLLQVSLKCMIRFFLKKKTLNELFSFQGSGILTTCTTKSLKKGKEVFSGFVCT